MIRIEQRDAKLIIFLTVLLILVVVFGGFYWGVQYSKTRFIEQASSGLNQLLKDNFSYVCGMGWDQYYLSNISIPFLVVES